MSESQAGGYAGDVSVKEAWDSLARSAAATLVDVRTQAEWAYVGVPVLSSIGKAAVLVEWDEFPTGALVPDFIGRLKSELDKLGIDKGAPLYFICRSGARSASAAAAMTAAGYRRCFNVAGGFEGARDGEGHRGTVEGWKAVKLPWVQS